MKSRKLDRGGLNFFFCLLLLTAGCTAVKEYRTGVTPIHYDHYDQTNSLAGKGVTNVIEVATNYTLGFVEFDDQGWLYGKKDMAGQSQIQIVTERAAEELQTNGLLFVVFIHGWKHNARWDDENVAMFHGVLQKLGDIELEKKKYGPARRVFGVYVGWRGLSMTTPGIYNLSFWARKSAAEQVGHGAVIQLLTELEALRDKSNLANNAGIEGDQRASTKLIAAGHSFGGDVLYCASSPVLTERMVENYNDQGIEQSLKSLGDLVVLINPAFEAARFETLQRLGVAAATNSVHGSNSTIAVFTSTGDTATGFWFPLGREVSTVFSRYRNRHEQRAANITAIGHYTPFINYDLEPIQKEPGEKIAQSHVRTDPKDFLNTIKAVNEKKTANRSKSILNTNDLTYDFSNSNCRLIPTKNYVVNDPVFNVRVSPAIIPDHDTINTTNFQAFLVDFFSTFARGEK